MSDRPKNFTLQETLEESDKRKSLRNRKEPETGVVRAVSWVGRLALLFGVVLAPWMIASVHVGPQFILASCVLLGLVCWWIESAMSSRTTQVVPYVAVPVLLGCALGGLQTVPLPAGLGGLLAGRQVEINEAVLGAEADTPVRLSLNVEGTWHQLRLLVIALGALLLGARFFRTSAHVKLFLWALTLNGVALAIVGFIQAASFEGKVLWVYELTNPAKPFGPFVCRNNAAGYLGICFAAAVGLFFLMITNKEQSRPYLIVSKEIPVWRQVSTYFAILMENISPLAMIVLVAAGTMALGVLGSLSRGGILGLLAAITFGTVVYAIARKPNFSGLLLFPLFVLAGLIAVWMGAGEQVINRFEAIDTLGEGPVDGRVQGWSDVSPVSFDHGVLGSGLGSFEQIHRLNRTDPEYKVYEFAENQYFQALVEAGVPGLLLLLMAIVLALGYAIFLLLRGSSGLSIGLGVFGSVALAGQAVCSMFDFGWYIPANMILLATSVGVIGYHCHSLAGRLKKKSLFRFVFPTGFCQAMILGCFLMTIFVVVDLYRRQAYRQVANVSLGKSYNKLDIESTDEKIAQVSALAKISPTVESLNYLGDLYVHRARHAYQRFRIDETGITGLDTSHEGVARNLWNMTSLLRMHEDVSNREASGPSRYVRKLKGSDFFDFDLRQALGFYRQSLQQVPLQPEVQRKVGMLACLLLEKDEAKAELNKTAFLSPRNPRYRQETALSLMLLGEREEARKHLAQILLHDRRKFNSVISLATGRSSRIVEPFAAEEILEDILPDDPKMLFDFARNFLPKSSPAWRSALRRADELLFDISLAHFDELILKANINFLLGNEEVGLDFLKMYVTSQPGDLKARHRLARHYFKIGMYREALEQAKRLVSGDRSSKVFEAFEKKAREAVREQKNQPHVPRDRSPEPQTRSLRNIEANRIEVTS